MVNLNIYIYSLHIYVYIYMYENLNELLLYNYIQLLLPTPIWRGPDKLLLQQKRLQDYRFSTARVQDSPDYFQLAGGGCCCRICMNVEVV